MSLCPVEGCKRPSDYLGLLQLRDARQSAKFDVLTTILDRLCGVLYTIGESDMLSDFANEGIVMADVLHEFAHGIRTQGYLLKNPLARSAWRRTAIEQSIRLAELDPEWCRSLLIKDRITGGRVLPRRLRTAWSGALR